MTFCIILWDWRYVSLCKLPIKLTLLLSPYVYLNFKKHLVHASDKDIATDILTTYMTMRQRYNLCKVQLLMQVNNMYVQH
jgi:hypothetical protein